MSTKMKLAVQLADEHLDKLTSDVVEIRMRALEQVETRLIRCLQHNQPIDFKPVYLLKQLIRWFGYKPPQAADRVLELLLELLRSDYGDVILRKMIFQRLYLELGKVRKILRHSEDRRTLDLLNDVEVVLVEKYKKRSTSAAKFVITPSISIGDTSSTSADKFVITPSISIDDTSSETDNTVDTLLPFSLSEDDYEVAWTRTCAGDKSLLKSIVTTFTMQHLNEKELHDNLTQLQIIICDYPAEWLLQEPHVYLNLLDLQKRSDGDLVSINLTILACLYQLQRRIQIRQNTLNYAACNDPPTTAKRQLRITSALALVLRSCLKLLNPIAFDYSPRTWHLFELIVVTIKTYQSITVAVPDVITRELAQLVKALIDKCHNNELSPLSLTDPRINSLIVNGLLQDTILLNCAYNSKVNIELYVNYVRILKMDVAYLTCVPGRAKSLTELCRELVINPSKEDEELVRLKHAYSLALQQLQTDTKMPAEKVLRVQRQICLVVDQLGSESLVQFLVDCVTECTPLYANDPELREDAEMLLITLADISDAALRSTYFRMLLRPVVDNFHALMHKTKYRTGCSNLELVHQNIMGIPISEKVLRKIIYISTIDSEDIVKTRCIDILTMILKLDKVLPVDDFQNTSKMLEPIIPLLVARASNEIELHKVLWPFLDPDSLYLPLVVKMHGNVSYMYNPSPDVRSAAMARVYYIATSQSCFKDMKPRTAEQDLSFLNSGLPLVLPQRNYNTIFSQSVDGPFTGKRSLDALVRLLTTPDMKPHIRKSTFIQLNTMLQNWEAAMAFSEYKIYNVILEFLYSHLTTENRGDPPDTLMPVVSIILKQLCADVSFRWKMYETPEIYVCLLSVLFMSRNINNVREEISICLFLMLYCNVIKTNASTLTFEIDVGDSFVPVSHETLLATPVTPMVEGTKIQQNLLQMLFDGDEVMAERHWRIFIAYRICRKPEQIGLSRMENLDIRKAMKIKPIELKLVMASQADLQLIQHLKNACNSSSHEALGKHIGCIQNLLVLMRFTVARESAAQLWKLMHKYLRITPNNSADLKLFISLLELCQTCLRHGLVEVYDGLNKALETDPHHSFLSLLQDRGQPLDRRQQVSDCLFELLHLAQDQRCTWHNNLFIQLSEAVRTHFNLRQLHHARCLLKVLRGLSGRDLALSDSQIYHYYLHYIQLSSDLRTATQTGAQWQRDCLYIMCQLYNQAQAHPPEAEKLAYKLLNYSIRLTGHCDEEVRVLAWTVTGNWIYSAGTGMMDILPRLMDLPGGLLACCLVTLTDQFEVMLVREMAGRVFQQLMPLVGAKESGKLMQKHKFLDEAYIALENIHLDRTLLDALQKRDTVRKSSCEIITCYVGICVRLIKLQPFWASVVCYHAFMSQLSDTVKMSTPGTCNRVAYIQLCAQIFELWVCCYPTVFEFLKSTICRDPVLLRCLIHLLAEVSEQRMLAEMQILMKALMMFCKSPSAYEYLCEQFDERPDVLYDCLRIGLNQKCHNTPMQQMALSLLSFLLVKSQTVDEEHNILEILENFYDVHETSNTNNNSDKENNNFKGIKSEEKGEPTSHVIDKALKNQKYTQSTQKVKANAGKIEPANATEMLYLSLDRLFDEKFCQQTYDFTKQPQEINLQICEALGMLLKLSPMAVACARDLKLMERVLGLLSNFLNDSNVGNASTYVRRVGAHKSRGILDNLGLIFKLLLVWHSAHINFITDTLTAAYMVRILVQIWPWLSHSVQLKQTVLQLTAYLTDHSLEMCKQTSQIQSNSSHSLLQLMSRVADHETTKKEAPSSLNLPNKIIQYSLRVMMNCCACNEGRLSLMKMHVIDMFDAILPGSASADPKVKPSVLFSWLEFWEIYTRYETGAKTCHLSALLNVVKRSPPLCKKRIMCLRILRNMCFHNANRTQLVMNTDLMDLLLKIVARPMLYNELAANYGDEQFDCLQEHRLAVLCLWKLFGNGAKYKAMLRGTKLAKELSRLLHSLDTTQLSGAVEFSKGGAQIEALRKLLDNLFVSLKE